MATIFRENYLTGPRHDFTWAIPFPQLAVIDGYDANFAGIAGGESFGINLDHGGSGPTFVIITFPVAPPPPPFYTAITAAAEIQVQLTFANPAFAGVCTAVNGRVRLATDTMVQVVGAGYLTAEFLLVGLPVEQRVKAAPPTTMQPMVYLAEAALVRGDMASALYTLPPGTNVLNLIMQFFTLDTANQRPDPHFLLNWSDGTGSFYSSVEGALVIPAGPGIAYVPQYARVEQGPTFGDGPVLRVRKRIEVPPGAVGLSIVLLDHRDQRPAFNFPQRPLEAIMSAWPASWR